MRVFILLLVTLFLFGCMDQSHIIHSKSVSANTVIEQTKTQAQQAQEEYIALQKKRNRR